ncbi:MAG TPA: hypothetical protein VFW88_05290 [Burkholderiales bacterium]|nr:hypothetical protein [Burkholderiales bacterium]
MMILVLIHVRTKCVRNDGDPGKSFPLLRWQRQILRNPVSERPVFAVIFNQYDRRVLTAYSGFTGKQFRGARIKRLFLFRRPARTQEDLYQYDAVGSFSVKIIRIVDQSVRRVFGDYLEAITLRDVEAFVKRAVDGAADRVDFRFPASLDQVNANEGHGI